MAAGLRDVLALQGVTPVSAAPVTTTAGLRLGQLDGTWITGGTADTGATAGFRSILQLTGVWIDAANDAVVEPPVETPTFAGAGAIDVTDSRREKLLLQLRQIEQDEIMQIISVITEVLP